MQIEAVEIRNYRLFRDAKLTNLPRLSVVVGANGSGKSTLFDVFAFLRDALLTNVAAAVTRRGGFKELVSRGETGPIGITLTLRDNPKASATYRIEIVEEDGRVFVGREVLNLLRLEGTTFKLVDFKRGHGSTVTDEEAFGPKEGAESERINRILDDPSTLAIKGLGQFKEFGLVSELRNLIENWHISDIRTEDARRSADAGYAEHLSTSGDNIPLVARYLYEHHRDIFDRILEVMNTRVPGVSGVDAKATEDGRLVLRFQDGSFKDPFIARYVSDGTIKMFAYLVLLYDPKPHPLLAVEEPENQLYPELLRELSEEFRDYARRGGQIFVSTHSPEFLNGLKPEEIFWLVKKQGFTTVYRASDDELLRNLVAEGDLPGSLWRQGLFEGVGPK